MNSTYLCVPSHKISERHMDMRALIWAHSLLALTEEPCVWYMPACHLWCNRGEQWRHSSVSGSVFSIHFPHRLFLNDLYKDEYAADKDNSGWLNLLKGVLATRKTKTKHFCLVFSSYKLFECSKILCVLSWFVTHNPTCLVIYEENEWRKHFRTARCDVSAQL